MTINWDAVRDELTAHLQALLRIDTVNPPGNETVAAEYLAGVAREAGIPYEIAARTPARGNFVARLAGNGAGRPVLLLGHVDVVGGDKLGVFRALRAQQHTQAGAVGADHFVHAFGGELAAGRDQIQDGADAGDI